MKLTNASNKKKIIFLFGLKKITWKACLNNYLDLDLFYNFISK